ncbi:MAG: 3-dehydroquinate dehydratase [Polyangiaceae bacterium]|nr:3-dehydroquinate dehydratase [Polyangiaceae bacterium]
MKKILILSGPNLGRLGKREPEIYGSKTLQDVHEDVAQSLGSGFTSSGRQSNHEGELISWIGETEDEGIDGIIFNPGAYTHTSYALYDAIRGSSLPVIEVHISNPDAREEFRKTSTIAPACAGRVAGFGTTSYVLAAQGLAALLLKN